jgi:hypothetical protein
MAQYQTADGRWIVGNVSGDSNYHGFIGWRDCVIQLTADGATEQSVRYLEALRDYALAHNPLGEPIMPPSINVWISNNGTTTAIQADDLSIDGDKFTIGGIVWNGSAWDYSDAGQASGGGSAPFVVVLTPTAADLSGTMSATVGEINEAYENGRKVVFKVNSSDHVFTADCVSQFFSNSYTYPSFNGYIIDYFRNMLILVYTGSTNDSASKTYNAKVYTLTSAI